MVIEDKEKNETTNEGLNEVFEGARKLVMGMEKAKKYTIKNFAGNRPQSSKEDFVIGQKERFINVAGIQSPGLTAAPAIAEYVAETLKYSTKMEHNENFNPTRKRIAAFRTMSDIERAHAIKNDEKYGHLVCRCEQVSEAEIIEAIRRGARTVDGIKFRTRCGMGRCQSGFDLPFVLEILKRETGIDVRDIRKNSDGSEVVKAKTKEFLKEA